ncbi:hypothetical protein POM88_023305 [Heracleum sosnowskyi]|uniref:Uncharacterized protein n=1 Tax=Heracleum sosnowskyi TaxID=360622 RepID=A0AAD8IKF8_9APIA|nr:hypothetical protein POM88_023305 [Heracleum sosnowskyi]
MRNLGLESPDEIPKDEDGEPIYEDFICQAWSGACSFLSVYPQIMLVTCKDSVASKSEGQNVENALPACVSSDDLEKGGCIGDSVKAGCTEANPSSGVVVKTLEGNSETNQNYIEYTIQDSLSNNFPATRNVESWWSLSNVPRIWKSYAEAVCSGRAGHSEVLKELLHSFPNLVMTTDASNSTTLHTATAQGHIDVVNLLLDADSNLAKIARNNGKTVLHIAARMGHLEVAKSLLSKYPSIGFRTDLKGQTALHMATTRGTRHYILQQERVVLSTRSHFSIKLGVCVVTTCLKIVSCLVSVEGINVNAVNKSGETPLDIAVKFGTPELKYSSSTYLSRPLLELTVYWCSTDLSVEFADVTGEIPVLESVVLMWLPHYHNLLLPHPGHISSISKPNMEKYIYALIS